MAVSNRDYFLRICEELSGHPCFVMTWVPVLRRRWSKRLKGYVEYRDTFIRQAWGVLIAYSGCGELTLQLANTSFRHFGKGDELIVLLDAD